MGNNKNESPLGKFLAFIGFFAGLAAGAEAGAGPAIVAGLIFAVIGYGVGAWVEKLLAYVFFLAVAIVMFLINSAIRRAIVEALFQQ